MTGLVALVGPQIQHPGSKGFLFPKLIIINMRKDIKLHPAGKTTSKHHRMKRSVMLTLWLLLGTFSAFDSSAVPWDSPLDSSPPDPPSPESPPLSAVLLDYPQDRPPPKRPPPDLYTMVRDLSAELARLQAYINKAKAQLEAEIHKLKDQVKASQVAFSASLVAGGTKTVGPLPTPTTLVFSHVTVNVGNAYNAYTGLFTAPVKGVYHFDWTVGAFGDGSHGAGAWLVKNSEKVSLAFEIQKYGFMSGSKGVSLSLLKGDVVSLLLLGNGKVYDDNNRHTTFSGHLLFLV